MMNHQLFGVRPVDVPYSALKLSGGIHIQHQHIPAFPFMRWPNGRPCDAVNMYFLDIAHSVTGDSLKTYASDLSQFIRYCGGLGIGFEDLTDDHLFDFSSKLQSERSKCRPDERARNNNTIRSIFSMVIRFLQWYQKHFVSVLATPLIGEASESPKIIVKRLKNQAMKSKRTEYYFVHRAMPTRESREPKRPIAQPVIEDIELCIDQQSRHDVQSVKFAQRFKSAPALMASQLHYLCCRRHFMVWIMKRAGLRPSEMVEMSAMEHQTVLEVKRLLIPTKKRRRNVAPKRSFPITLKDATVVQRYLTARQKYCDALKMSGKEVVSADALFLGVDGAPIKKTSLEKDFARLATVAGYRNVQVCMSMFRHRFITYEVVVHLKEFMSGAGKSRQMMTNTDYESILKRIAVKTGHGSVASLWHYIDLAWSEIDVWGGVEKALGRLHAADRLHDDLLALRKEVEAIDGAGVATDVLRHLADRLSEILYSARLDIAST